MFKVKVWDKGNIMIFDGYTKTIPKSEFNPARYRITYEEINGS